MAQASNNIKVTWDAAPSGAVGKDVTRVAIYTALTAGTQLAVRNITSNPAPLALNDRYEADVGAIELEVLMGSGGFTDDAAQEALKGIVAGTRYLEVQDGSGAITGIPREPITSAQWTIAAAS